MKVLHVIDALGVGGGAEHSLATMLPMMRDLGVDSSVVVLLPREGGLQQELREQGFSVEVLDASGWPGRVRALRRRVHKERPDLVHATLVNSCLVARLAMVGSDVPLLNSLVNTTYDPVRLQHLPIAPWKMTTMRTVDGFTARHLVDRFHAITGAVRDEAVGTLGVSPERVTIVPRGRSRLALGEISETRRRESRAELGIPDDTPLILTVGRQDFQKAQPLLVEAFAATLQTIPDARLLIAGRPGDASKELACAIERTGAGNAVIQLGHRTDVLDLYVACDVFTFPSFYEGLGCSLVEAMALGIPIVGSDAPAIAEVLDYGAAGLVVPRNDVGRLSLAMIDLLSDTTLRKHYSTAGRARFERYYELDLVVRQMVQMYRTQLEISAGLDLG